MNELQIIEHAGQRVVTTAQLAEAYQTNENNIRVNFHNNQDRFIEGVHYYRLEGEDLRDFKDSVNDVNAVGKNANTVVLWTSKGASRHCKMLDTDEAWAQFERLEETYFNAKEQGLVSVDQILNNPRAIITVLQAYAEKQERVEVLEAENGIMRPKAEFYDTVTGSRTAIPFDQAAKVLGYRGMGRNNLFAFLRDCEVLQGNNMPYQAFVDRGYFRVVESKYTKPNGDTGINIKTLIYQKGLDYVRKLLDKAGYKQSIVMLVNG